MAVRKIRVLELGAGPDGGIAYRMATHLNKSTRSRDNVEIFASDKEEIVVPELNNFKGFKKLGGKDISVLLKELQEKGEKFHYIRADSP